MTDYEIYSLQSYTDGTQEDLRPIKTKKKVSGCHRSYRGLKDYCNSSNRQRNKIRKV